MNRLIQFSVHHRYLVLTLTFLLLLGGWWSFLRLPIDAVPDITNLQVQINTPVEGLAPEEVERTITYRIETALGGIPGVIQVRSMTRFDLSQVTVVFAEGTDIYRARQLVTERIQEIAEDLPSKTKPKLGPVTTGLGEIVHYQIVGPEKAEHSLADLMEWRSLQEFYIRPRLLTVTGVADVGTIGGYQKQFLVQPDPEAMARYGIHFDDLSEALEKVNRNVGSGYLQQTAEQFVVQGLGRLKDSAAIREVPIKTLENLRTVRIGDLAEVKEGPGLRMGAALVDGREAVLGTVMMLVGENSRTVSERVTDKIAAIEKELPPGVRLEILYDRSDLVNATLSTVEHNLLYGAALVVLVLALMIGNLRAALITALTIPASLLMTFLMMKPLGLSGNLMSLGALDFGIIVDGVVIVMDNCVRLIEERSRELKRPLREAERKQAIVDATVQVRSAAGFGELIILVAFAPIFALSGIEGKMFQPMAATFMLALFSALILSFTAGPALAGLLLGGNAKDREPIAMRGARWLYLRVLNRLVRVPKLALTCAIFLVIGSAVLFTRLGAQFMPQLDEGSAVLQFFRPTDISLDQSIAMQRLSEKTIAEFPEVSHVFSKIGTADVATDPMPINVVDTFVMLKGFPKADALPKEFRKKAQLNQAMVERLESLIPGQKILPTQPIEMRFNELLEGVRSDVSLKFFGVDLEILGAAARKAAHLIEEVPGAGEVETDARGKSPILKIEAKEETLRSIGISQEEILETIAIAVGGKTVGAIYEGLRDFPLVIRLEESARSNIEALKKIPVGIFANKTLPLSELTDLHFEQTYGTILRENNQRRVAVLINSADQDMQGFVERAQKAIDGAIELPDQYFMEWGGNYRNLQEAKQRLFWLFPGVLVLIFLMVYAAFRNAWQATLILLCVPFALVGGVLNLWWMGLPFSLSAAVGFVALSGIAVLNGLVLSNFFNELYRQGLRGMEWVRQGSLLRLRPVLMTALVEIFGFLPMMLSQGVGADVQRPLATVVIGGIFSSMALTLLLLPLLYKILEKKIFSPIMETETR